MRLTAGPWLGSGRGAVRRDRRRRRSSLPSARVLERTIDALREFPSQADALRTSPVARALLAAALLTAAGALILGSIIFSPGSRILGGFNDAALTVRSYDAIDQAGKTPFTYRRDEFNGAPEGVPAVRAIAFAAPIQPAVIWLLKKPFGFVGALNAFLLGGLLLTGVAMFALLDHFRFGFLPSLFGAYLVTFNPWMYERVFSGHVAFTHGWTLVLLLYTLFRVRRDSTVTSAAIAGAVFGLCFLMASYTGLLATALVAAFVVVELLTARNWAARLWTATLLLATTSVLIVFLLPGLIAFYADHTTVTSALSRPNDALADTLSASPLDYALPSPRQPLLGDDGDRLRPGDVFHERVVFVGYTTIVLSVVAAVRLFRRRRQRPDLSKDRRELLWLAAAAGTIALILSLGKDLSIGSVDVPLPADVIGEVTTFYRVYARFGFVVAIATAILAAWTLSSLRRRRFGTAAIVALIAVAAFETFPSRTDAVAMDELPAHDVWLAQQPRGIVAHYPMMTDRLPSEKLAARELYYERFVRQPLFEIYGVARTGTREDAIRLLARDLSGPGVPGILAAEGVRYIVVHDDVYRAQDQTPPAARRAMHLLRRFGPVRIFRLDARPIDLDRVLARYTVEVAELWGLGALPVVRTSDGFRAGERYFKYPGKWRWMTQGAILLVTNNQMGPVTIRIEGLAFANVEKRRLELRDANGRTLATTIVPGYLKKVRLGPLRLPPGTFRFTLAASPGPAPLGPGDARDGTIFFSPLRGPQLADYSKTLRDR